MGAESPPVVCLLGATTSGKTALSLDLADALGGEVVNTDSMQLYRGLDIGTAKLPVDERRGIPHHLLDVLDVRDRASVAVFQREARAVVADLRSRGRVPVLVGGSALYHRAVVDRLDFPGTDPGLRAELEGDLERDGVEAMHARLREADPEAAGRIEARNGRRIVRALEVLALTGRPFAAELPRHDYVLGPTIQLGLSVPRPTLDARIAARVDQMWETGLLDEVRGLEERGLREGPTASRAIGYRQALAQIDGELTREGAAMATMVATRRFVRRQEAWWRRDPRIVWLDAEAGGLVDRAVAAVRAVGAPS